MEGKTSDGSGNASSSLAISEKRTASSQRPGGCVGIFFQLFDWNRRLAKKKLFSKKFLPPVRSKQASKKFNGDEKMSASKLHLIADENEGGFPNPKKHSNGRGSNSETRSPSLVARLMGLESMPAAIREKPKKGSFSEACDYGEKSFVGNDNGCGNVEVNTERGSVKLDSRPQKLQKTGQFESKSVTRYGAESAFQIKNVLSRSRSHYRNHRSPKFAPPIKSPRMPSVKNVSRKSRLIDAATRILEPGLQSSSKSKYALSYSSSVHYQRPSNGAATEGILYNSDEQTNHGSFYNAVDSLTGQPSCRSCGNMIDGSLILPPFTSGFVNGCSSIPASPFVQETEPNFQKSWNRRESLVSDVDVTDISLSNRSAAPERKFMPREGLAPWPSSNLPRSFRIDKNLKQRVHTSDQVQFGRDRTPPKINPKPNIAESRRVSSSANTLRGTKDFVSLNRSLSGRVRPRVPTRAENSGKFVPERKAYDERDETLPQLRTSSRKRGFKPRNSDCGSVNANGCDLDAHSMNPSFSKNRISGRREDSDGNSDDATSFRFSSPSRRNQRRSMSPEEKAVGAETRKSGLTPLTLEGDSIATLLEQKLKELTSHEDDEFSMGNLPKRSTAMILQELISALTLERPDIASASAAERKNEMSAGIFHVADHLSPGSVLGASFSSSSLDDSSGHMLYTDSIDYSSNGSDSASSSGKPMTGLQRIMALVATVSRVLNAINLAGGRLTDSGLAHAKQIVVNAELLFGNVNMHGLEGLDRLFLGPILLELEAIANIAWTNVSVLTGADPTKGGNQYRGFLFDCLIECLERNYGEYPNTGFKAWTKMLPGVDREAIIGDVEKEMKKWTGLAGMFTDELVVWEMNHGLGRWTIFDIEAFELGEVACNEILNGLIAEYVNDLCE